VAPARRRPPDQFSLSPSEGRRSEPAVAPGSRGYPGLVAAWPMPTPPAHWAAPGQPVFVGRRSERAVLDRAWREAQPGVLRLVLVCGGAGSGKSRLVCEAANTFHRQGAAVLAGGCNADFARPFDPVAEPVRVLLPWTAQGQIQLGDEVAAQADVVDRLRVVAGGESGGPLPSTRLLFDAVSRLIVAATTPRPRQPRPPRRPLPHRLRRRRLTCVQSTQNDVAASVPSVARLSRDPCTQSRRSARVASDCTDAVRTRLASSPVTGGASCIAARPIRRGIAQPIISSARNVQ
jgi:hypothetical protein